MKTPLARLNRVTMFYVIEVDKANPNGDPDKEGEPRTYDNGHGWISPQSIKHHYRDLIEDKESVVWQDIGDELLHLNPDEFRILESRTRGFGDDITPAKSWEKVRQLSVDEIRDHYVDARWFGATMLSNQKKDQGTEYCRAGALFLNEGYSVAPVIITRATLTREANTEADKERGMAPMANKSVIHGIYCVYGSLDVEGARKSGCTQRDLELFKKLTPEIYKQTSSDCRFGTNLLHVWWMEHKSRLGSCSESALWEALTPKRKGEDPNKPSESKNDYIIPTSLPTALESKLASCVDLVDNN